MAEYRIIKQGTMYYIESYYNIDNWRPVNAIGVITGDEECPKVYHDELEAIQAMKDFKQKKQVLYHCKDLE